MTAATIITVRLPNGAGQVNLWLFDDPLGTVEVNFREAEGDGWRPLEHVGGTVDVAWQGAA